MPHEIKASVGSSWISRRGPVSRNTKSSSVCMDKRGDKHVHPTESELPIVKFKVCETHRSRVDRAKLVEDDAGTAMKPSSSSSSKAAVETETLSNTVTKCPGFTISASELVDKLPAHYLRDNLKIAYSNGAWRSNMCPVTYMSESMASGSYRRSFDDIVSTPKVAALAVMVARRVRRLLAAVICLAECVS